MKIILIIMVGLSMLNAEITKSGNIVKDSVSKLEWQDDAVGSTMKWESAIQHCENLTLDGLADWRLPNINELKSIVNRDNGPPAIVTGFVNTSTADYWSSTSVKDDKSWAWFIVFGFGNEAALPKFTSDDDSNKAVRCVRDGE